MPGSREDQLASPTLAELYYQQGDLRKAIEVLRQVLKNQPGNLKARELLQNREKEWFQLRPVEEKKESAERLGQIMERIRKEKGK